MGSSFLSEKIKNIIKNQAKEENITTRKVNEVDVEV